MLFNPNNADIVFASANPLAPGESLRRPRRTKIYLTRWIY